MNCAKSETLLFLFIIIMATQGVENSINIFEKLFNPIQNIVITIIIIINI